MLRILFFISALLFLGCPDTSSSPNYWISKKNLIYKTYVSNDTNNNSITDNVEKDILNNNPQIDTYESNMWHLRALSIDFINKKYMGYKNGVYMHIQVVDEGVEPTHEDLKDNIDTARSIDAISGKSGTLGANGPHGTKCAGLIAARGYNGKGIRGIAPFAKISSVNWIKKQQIAELEKAWFSGDGANGIVVSSNSWGSCDNFNQFAKEQEKILKLGSTTLRYSLGRIYVFSAGNSRRGGNGCPTNAIGSANLDEARNNQYVITVGAISKSEKVAPYSSPGSNILISTYGGVGGADYLFTTTKNNAYTNFAGTSASAPIVSGSIALILEACPDLKYQEVQYLLAKTASQIDVNNPTWVKNSAGMWHSVDYGYGKLEPLEAIIACEAGRYRLKNSYEASTKIKVDEATNQNSFIVDMTINKAFKARWVGVNIAGSFTRFNQLEIYLISPKGVKTQLLHRNNPLSYMRDDIRLGSFAFIDEPTKGVWKLEVKNKFIYDELTSVELDIVGH